MQLSPLTLEMYTKARHVVSSNNIYDLPGVVMYAVGAGVTTVKSLVTIHVADTIRLYPSFHPEQTIAEFATVEDFIAWCEVNGEVSAPSPYQDWCD